MAIYSTNQVRHVYVADANSSCTEYPDGSYKMFFKNAKGETGVGSSASFPVPNKYVEPIKTETLGTVMDNIFNESDLRSSTGGIGLLTKEVVTRIDLSCDAFLMALTPFINSIWKD